MLNISHNSIREKIDTQKYKTFAILEETRSYGVAARLLVGSLLLLIIATMFPWTQNIRGVGNVTALEPEQRPQAINSIIEGRIEKWYVREGQFVEKGDTIIFLSETKDAYFDPELLSRSQLQIDAKSSSVKAYTGKAGALDNQINALKKTLELKLQQTSNYVRQAQLKVISDSIDFQASKINFEVAKLQFERVGSLYNEGIKSRTDLEEKKIKLQETQAKMISAENKLLTSQNALINATMELASVENQYLDKLAKAQSDKFSTLSSMYEAEGEVTKLENMYANYSVRISNYFITAPQSGYITQAIKTGIGEAVKAGERLMTIMPSRYDLAAEIYIRPVDLPLIDTGQHVRFIFDGWPSIVFAGWPDASFGTFGGKVVAIDNFISENGKYRLLVAPDPDDVPWPTGLRVGSGAMGMALLKDVPIWYELWRNINGFPPKFYQSKEVKNQAAKKEK